MHGGATGGNATENPPKAFCDFVCNGKIQNERRTRLQQLEERLHQLRLQRPSLSQLHSVICEREGGDTANVELCNPVIREIGI